MNDSGITSQDTAVFGKTMQALLMAAFVPSNFAPFLKKITDILCSPGGLGRKTALAIVLKDHSGRMITVFCNTPAEERRKMAASLKKSYSGGKKIVFNSEIRPGAAFSGRIMARAGKVPQQPEAAAGLVDTAAKIIGARIAGEKRDTELAFERDLSSSVKHIEELYLSYPGISIEEISRAVLDEARRMTCSNFGFAGYIDPATGWLRVPTLTRDAVKGTIAPAHPVVFKEYAGLWGWTLKRKKALLTNSARDDKRAVPLPQGHVKIDKFLGVPAMSGRKLLGMLALANPTADYGPAELETAQKLARVYAMILRHKLAEQQRQADDAKYKSILDTSGDLIFNLAVDGKLAYASRAMENYGYTQDEVTGRHFSRFVHPADRKRLERSFLTALQAGQSLVPLLTYRMRRKDGSYATIEQKSAIIPRPGTAPIITGIMRDVTASRQAERILRDIVEKNPLAIQILDKDGFTLKVNVAFIGIFGTKPPPDYSIFKDPQLKKHGFIESFERVKKGEVLNFPDTLYNAHDSDSKAPDSPHWLRAVVFPLCDEKGNPERFVIMHENITERKLAEDRQRDEDARFKAIISSSKDIIYTADLKGKLTYISPRVQDYGYAPESLLGHSIIEFAHPEDKEFITKAFANTVKTGRTLPIIPFRIKKKDGSYFYAEQKSGTVSVDGKPAYMTGVVRDVTEQKKTELRLKESEALMRMVFDTAKDPIFIKNMDGMYVKVNKACADLMGTSAEEMIGRSDSDYFDHEAAEAVFRTDSEVVRTGKTLSLNNLHPFPTGARYVNIVKTPLKNADGQTIGLLGIARDISELKRMETELALARAAEAVSSVARPMAHDFNNALAAINGYATLIDDGMAADNPIKNEITQIIRAVQRAAELTSKFQDFARNPKIDGKENIDAK